MNHRQKVEVTTATTIDFKGDIAKHSPSIAANAKYKRKSYDNILKG